LRGAEGLLRDLRSGVSSHSVEIERTSECFGACHRAPMARVNEQYREGLVGDARQALIDELNKA
jgi:NADH:ubiquinone oxidoreductase subunit E